MGKNENELLFFDNVELMIKKKCEKNQVDLSWFPIGKSHDLEELKNKNKELEKAKKEKEKEGEEEHEKCCKCCKCKKKGPVL